MSSTDYAIIAACVLVFSALCTFSWWLQNRNDEELAQCVAEYPQLASAKLVDRDDHDIRRLCNRLRAVERVEWAQKEAIVSYCYQHLPATCWGSEERFTAWRNGGETQ